MQKYISKIDKVDIRYFEDDVDVSDWIYLTQYRLMTESEVLKHETNPYTDYHVWNEDLSKWVDGRTPEQLTEFKRQNMPTLSPIEFDIKLNNAKLYDAVQELIKDNFEMRIAYNRATFFSRTSSFVDQARIALGLTDEQVDAMWEQAITL